MAHVAHHGMSSSSHGNRRGKQHNRNLEAMLGINTPRRSGTRPQIRSQYSSGMPMGAYRGTSVASTHSDYSGPAAMNYNLRLGLRVVSVLAVITGAVMLTCGLFLNPGILILGLCIPGGLMIVAVLLLWCVMYVLHGEYCIKTTGSTTLSSPGHAAGGGATHRPARGDAEGATVDLQLSRSATSEVMSSYGPNTSMGAQHHPSHPPPCYSPIDRCGSFPTSGPSVEQPPSTPPPPYDEVT